MLTVFDRPVAAMYVEPIVLIFSTAENLPLFSNCISVEHLTSCSYKYCVYLIKI